MSSFLFYAGVIGLVVGIYVRSVYTLGLPLIALCVLLSLIFALLWRRAHKPSPILLYASIFLILFSLGMMRMEYASWNEESHFYETHLGSTVTLEGVVHREVEHRERSSHVYVQVEDELILAFAPVHTQAEYGDRVSITGSLEKPEAFETDLGRVFDYQNYLRARGVNYTISFAELEVLSSGEGNPIIAPLLAFKHAFMKQVERVISQPEAGLGEGLLLGVKQALGEDLEEAFRTTGITHIVVLSGYNVMLVIVFVMYVLAFILPLRAQLLVGLIAVALFALLVGLSATVVRASLMASLILVAKVSGRTYAVTRALVLTGIAMLLLNPYLLVYDVGFQLSFIATLGLIQLAPHIEKYLHFMPTTIGLRGFLTATIATQIFVAPILLYQIGELSIISIVVNVLVLPMVPVAMLLTFATGMLAFVSVHLAFVIGWFASWSLWYILFIAETFAKMPFASFTLPAFPFVITVIVYASFAFLLWHLHARGGIKKIGLIAGWTIMEESQLAQQLQAKQENSENVLGFFR